MIVACVWTGTKYNVTYVTKLFHMVRRHLPIRHDFYVLTDHDLVLPGMYVVDVSRYGLSTWWAKMALFEPVWRQGRTVLYFDLDTVIINDLEPLARLESEFAICANFTRRAGHPNFPCSYGSCVMRIGADRMTGVWEGFRAQQANIIGACQHYGDQMAIEWLAPDATLLQDVMPVGYFVGRRELVKYPKKPPDGAAIIVFSGPLRPSNCNFAWIREAWQ